MKINFASGGQKKAHQAAVKWVEREVRRRVRRGMVMVREVSCQEPGCVPLETLVILLPPEEPSSSPLIATSSNDDGSRTDAHLSPKWTRWMGKILKPVAEVLAEDIQELDLPEWSSWEREISSTMEEKQKISLQHASDINDSSKSPTVITMKPRKGLNPIEQEMEKDIYRNDAPPIPPTPESLSTSAASSNFVEKPNIAKTTNNNTKMPLPKRQLVSSIVSSSDTLPKARHSSKGVRQRGCPCCDPDNMDNILDKIIYFDAPP